MVYEEYAIETFKTKKKLRRKKFERESKSRMW